MTPGYRGKGPQTHCTPVPPPIYRRTACPQDSRVRILKRRSSDSGVSILSPKMQPGIQCCLRKAQNIWLFFFFSVLKIVLFWIKKKRYIRLKAPSHHSRKADRGGASQLPGPTPFQQELRLFIQGQDTRIVPSRAGQEASALPGTVQAPSSQHKKGREERVLCRCLSRPEPLLFQDSHPGTATLIYPKVRGRKGGRKQSTGPAHTASGPAQGPAQGSGPKPRSCPAAPGPLCFLGGGRHGPGDAGTTSHSLLGLNQEYRIRWWELCGCFSCQVSRFKVGFLP